MFQTCFFSLLLRCLFQLQNAFFGMGTLLNLSEKIALDVSFISTLFLQNGSSMAHYKDSHGEVSKNSFLSFAIRKTTLAILFITVGMRWGKQEVIYNRLLADSISLSMLLILHSAVFINELWKSEFFLELQIMFFEIPKQTKLSYFWISLHFSWFQLFPIAKIAEIMLENYWFQL